MIEYICLNPKCKQVQSLDEIYDEEYNCLHCSYCLGKDFFEREVEFDELDREFK